MFSKILLKLIEESITPAFAFIFFKILITVYLGNSLGYNVDIYNVFSLEVSKEAYILINSYILVLFSLFCFLGMMYSAIKSLYFHRSHIHPSMTLSLFNFRATFLIQESFHLYSQSLIWLIYSYISLFLTMILFFLGLTNGYVLLLTCVLCPISTYFFVLDLENELEKDSEEEEVYV